MAGAAHLRGRAIGDALGRRAPARGPGGRARARPAGWCCSTSRPPSSTSAAADALVATLRGLADAGAARRAGRAPPRARRARRPTASSPCATGGSPTPDRRAAGPAPRAPPPAGPGARRGWRASTPAHPGRPVLRGASLELRARRGDDARRPERQRQDHAAARARRPAPARRRRAWCWTGADVTDRARPSAASPRSAWSARTRAATCSPSASTTRSAFALRTARRARRPSAGRGWRGCSTTLRLSGLADRHPLDLSVGQRERVALAAILVADPGVIAARRAHPRHGPGGHGRPRRPAARARRRGRRRAGGDPRRRLRAPRSADRALVLADGAVAPAAAPGRAVRVSPAATVVVVLTLLLALGPGGPRARAAAAPRSWPWWRPWARWPPPGGCSSRRSRGSSRSRSPAS